MHLVFYKKKCVVLLDFFFTPKHVDKNCCTTPGRMVSHVSISFEKRLSMRPNGVVSNSSVGQRIILLISLTNTSMEQFRQPNAKHSPDKYRDMTKRM